ncbi:hypothetical protein [Thermococcus sp. JdF3]|uniref:hypothetical protein n=1 Tax=Thermococcus sp. JdF3 TaxID=1638258 RepID=UPI001438FEED|nr:hypothetical protein [Thermococcus sp. JdF3]NJE01721.1 hypothetical protein [Thermococcus sp. JdF3]
MPYIGFARSPYGPAKTYELIMDELRKRGFRIGFSKHHWMGDAPFGLVVVETERGAIAIRWNIGDAFTIRLEEVNDDDWDGFVEDTLEYLSGD